MNHEQHMEAFRKAQADTRTEGETALDAAVDRMMAENPALASNREFLKDFMRTHPTVPETAEDRAMLAKGEKSLDPAYREPAVEEWDRFGKF